jgi:Rps23 Pro-64 3,4-dihydroxylase Tpa1-like proline 4-hydroxylase
MMVFDYQEFEKQILLTHQDYCERTPYPFAVFDGLFDNQLLQEINGEIDQSTFQQDTRSIDGEEIKTRSDFEDNEALPPSMRAVFEVINGGKFLNLVSKLTQIEGLISDPYYDGGGVNVIRNNGTLAVHVDGTTQHRMKVCRRINAILFLNDEWKLSWNGYHEQWVFLNPALAPDNENQHWKCIRKVLPKKNRLYIFTTNDHSWHGHAGTLNVPEEVERRSLISYYYTATRPASDLVFEAPHRALFINNRLTLQSGAYDDVEVIL